MLKKIIPSTALAVVLLSSSAQAEREVPRDGFYVGLMTGVSGFSGKGTFSSPTAGGVTTQRVQKASIHDTSLKTSVFVGYEENFSNHVLLGGQALYSYNSLNASKKVTTPASGTAGRLSSVSVKQTHTYGALVKAGLPLHDSMAAYLTLGALNSRFRFAHTPVSSTDGYSGASKIKTAWAFTPGVEFKLGVTSHLSFHASLQYSMYQTIKTDLTGSTTVARTGTATYKITPRMTDLMIGLSYKI